MTLPCCAKLMPHPDSEPAGSVHHKPSAWTPFAANPPLTAATAAPASSMPAPQVSMVHRHSSWSTGSPMASYFGGVHWTTVGSLLVVGNGRAVDSSTMRACDGVSDGCTANINATVPDTSGVEKLVPSEGL